MNITTRVITPKNADPFRIARCQEARTEKQSVIIRLEHDGVVGLGEAQPSP